MLLSTHLSQRLGNGLRVPATWRGDLPEGAKVYVVNGAHGIDVVLGSAFRQKRRNSRVVACQVEGGSITIPPTWLSKKGLAGSVMLEGHVSWFRVISIARFRRQVKEARSRARHR